MFKFEQYKKNIVNNENTFLEHIEIHGTQTQKNSVQYLKNILNVKFPESKNETAANTSKPVIGNNMYDIGTPLDMLGGGGNKKMSIKKTKKKRKNNKKSKTLPRRQFNKRKKNKEK